MFGPRVGFLKFRSTCILAVGGEDGEVEVPGIVFMRGGARRGGEVILMPASLFCMDNQV
jgi:hypothetical protein